MGERLRAEARLIGPATHPGPALRVSWYPGVVESARPEQRVHGEVYALDNPAGRSHGSTPTRASCREAERGGEYERLERPVRLATGEEIAAWVYLYRRDVSGPPARRRRALDGRARASESGLAFARALGTIRTNDGLRRAVAGPKSGGAPVSSRYHEVYAAWKRDPEAFWAEAAREIDWYKPWDKVFDPYAGQYGRWFVGAECNTAWNCLDRHVERGRGAAEGADLRQPRHQDHAGLHLRRAARRGGDAGRRAAGPGRRARATASSSTCRWCPRR